MHYQVFFCKIINLSTENLCITYVYFLEFFFRIISFRKLMPVHFNDILTSFWRHFSGNFLFLSNRWINFLKHIHKLFCNLIKFPKKSEEKFPIFILTNFSRQFRDNLLLSNLFQSVDRLLGATFSFLCNFFCSEFLPPWNEWLRFLALFSAWLVEPPFDSSATLFESDL